MNIAVWMLLSHSYICTVSNCCFSLYLHVAVDFNRVLQNTFGVLERPGIYVRLKQWEPCMMIVWRIRGKIIRTVLYCVTQLCAH